MQWAGAGLVLVLALGAGAWYSRATPQPPPLVVATAAPEARTITVHVSGRVPSPGLVEVPEGARVADAVAAAGGVLPGADLSSLNLAAPLTDGQQLLVARPATGAEGGGFASRDGRVRVNTASVADLERLPGVGPVLAERIIEHRDRFGPFGRVEDLLDVPGIGEGKLAAMRDAVLVP